MKFIHLIVLLLALTTISSGFSKRSSRTGSSSRARTASKLKSQYRALQKDIKVQENINKKYDEISAASEEIKKTIDQIVKAKKAIKGVPKEVADQIIANAAKVEETMKNNTLDKKSKKDIVDKLHENSKTLLSQNKKDNSNRTINHSDKDKDKTAKEAATKTDANKKVVNSVVPQIVKKVEKLSKELGNDKTKKDAEAKLSTQIGLLKTVATTNGAKNMSEATLPKIQANLEEIKKLAKAGKTAEVAKLEKENKFLVDLAKKHTPLKADEKEKLEKQKKLIEDIKKNKNITPKDQEKLTMKDVLAPKIKANESQIKSVEKSKLPEEEKKFQTESLKAENEFLKEQVSKNTGSLLNTIGRITKKADDALQADIENMSREEFRKWILEKYDHISHELGVETRAISSVQNLLKLRKNGPEKAGKEEEEAFLLNNFQNKVQNDVLLVVAQAKEVVARRKIDTRRNINPLINNQDELHHLATVTSREGKLNTRDFRARAVKILRNYHLAMKLAPQ